MRYNQNESLLALTGIKICTALLPRMDNTSTTNKQKSQNKKKDEKFETINKEDKQ